MLPAIKELIVTRALGDEDKDRNLLAHELREEIEKKFPQQIPPTKTTIVKKISEARNHATDPLDKHWHLGLLDKIQNYGISYISADEVNAIIRVQHWLYDTAQDSIGAFLKNEGKSFKELTVPLSTLSIRQAKWISVLHRKIGKDPEHLWLASLYYAYREIITSISDTPFDTWQIDVLLLRDEKKRFKKHLARLLKADLNYYGDDFEKAFNVLARIRYTNEFSKDDIEKFINDFKKDETSEGGN